MTGRRAPCVLLVSVDAMKPEFPLRPGAFGLDLPVLHGFLRDGAYAGGGVKGVLPTFTYPCHQTLVTGTYPATHGTANNLVFDPEGVHRGRWNWFATDRTPTLWQLAGEHGYAVASVCFPTSVGAPGDYVVPECWWDGSPLDGRLLDALSRPQGLAAEMAPEAGWAPSGLALTLEDDRRRAACAAWVLRRKLAPERARRPFLLTAYLGSYDETVHHHGVHSPEALANLAGLDPLVGGLVAEARRAAGDELVVCVVSDHGALDNRGCLRPNVRLREAGLVDLDDRGRVTGWRAWCQRAGGTAEVRLRPGAGPDLRARVAELLADLAAEPAGGIRTVLTGEAARRERRGFPEADFVLIAEKGWEFRDEALGAGHDPVPAIAAQHGYDEEYEEMRAWFAVTGPGLARGRDLGAMDLVDVAPTLAGLMGFPMPTAEGRDLGQRLR
jgi:predicted AlkP superfamily phosphohydrolase/phosphomutase